jgi:hypothetical protein
MLRLSSIFADSLVILLAGAMAPATANAAQFKWLVHLHPGRSHAHDSRISFTAYNKGPIFQDVKIDGHFYTVRPNQSLFIKAPAGTPIYAESTGRGHKRGELILAVTPDMDGKTVPFN